MFALGTEEMGKNDVNVLCDNFRVSIRLEMERMTRGFKPNLLQNHPQRSEKFPYTEQ
jgi:hypothetical protein